MRVVVNATPLIALSLINRLTLLKQLFNEVIVPSAVYEEVALQGIGRPGARVFRDSSWEILDFIGYLKVRHHVPDQLVEDLKNAQEPVMYRLWDNSEDEVWNDLWTWRTRCYSFSLFRSQRKQEKAGPCFDISRSAWRFHRFHP
jgi:hypothetical protein